MLKKEEILLISYFILVILVLVIFVVVFFYIFQRRKNKLLFEKWEAQKKYEQEIVRSRMEIQEQTLKNVGLELHDNIGQLLSVAKMQLNMLVATVEQEAKAQVQELNEILGNSLQEVRSLSRSLNNEVVDYVGLKTAIENELDRFKRLKMLDVTMLTSGEQIKIDQQHSIIIFRILQEFFSNAIKHAKATELEVKMIYKANGLNISVKDNGIGFIVEEVKRSSGLLNMASRAKLIGARLDLTSEPGHGTILFLQYPV